MTSKSICDNPDFFDFVPEKDRKVFEAYYKLGYDHGWCAGYNRGLESAFAEARRGIDEAEGNCSDAEPLEFDSIEEFMKAEEEEKNFKSIDQQIEEKQNAVQSPGRFLRKL